MTSKRVRAWVFIEPKVYNEIQGYAKDAGLKTTTFLNVAVVLDARTLARVGSPEKFIPPELLAELVKEQAQDAKQA